MLYFIIYLLMRNCLSIGYKLMRLNDPTSNCTHSQYPPSALCHYCSSLLETHQVGICSTLFGTRRVSIFVMAQVSAFGHLFPGRLGHRKVWCLGGHLFPGHLGHRKVRWLGRSIVVEWIVFSCRDEEGGRGGEVGCVGGVKYKRRKVGSTGTESSTVLYLLIGLLRLALRIH